ncbi:MAG: hypothetical protein IJT06_06780 [Selenomonadaceae bacterium]|nr:hypothetical protein [Selenomonadaceae bacterium]
MRKFFKYAAIFFAIIILVGVVILEMASRSATETFNAAMQEQTMLKGNITVEEISANLKGEVVFENLLWKDERGGTILEIPEGSFKVRLWDVITNDFKSTTIQKLSLRGANISVHLDENMQVDFIRHSQDFGKVNDSMKKDSDDWEEKVSRANKTEEELKEIGERRRRLQQSKIEKGWKNFEIEGHPLNLALNLEDCQIEVLYKERHYLLRGVSFETEIDTGNEMTLKLHTGTFGGTMIGRGMDINGGVDFKAEIPQCNLLISFMEVDPSSLGFGLNLHDKMTLYARFTGPITQPVGNGTVRMDELHLPGIDFKNVAGSIYYENALVDFKNVTADVYGGKLDAHGDYNIDTRYYNIYGHGDKLKAYIALPNSGLHCDVDLNITIQSKGNARETITSGDFVSGNGRYSILAFKSLSGKFKNEYKDLSFYDVNIDLGNYKLSTDAFSILDGKLHFDPIKVVDKDGNVVSTYKQ